MENDSLLFGKSNLKRVVGLEVADDKVEIFIQNEDNTISSIFKPHSYWLLSNNKIDNGFNRLDGELHYKWGRQFDSRVEFFKHRNFYKNEDTYIVWNADEACMIKDGYTFYRDLKMSDVSLLSFDIETTGLDPLADDARVLIISTSFRNHTGNIENLLFTYDDYANERDMLNDFCSYVRHCDPSIILGHNIISYDFTYLLGRADINGISLNMGRDGSALRQNERDSKFRLDGTRELLYKNVSIYGREICDTYLLAMSFDVSKAFETYTLKPLIKQLGFEKEGRQYYDAGNIRDNYKNSEEWKKIVKYAEEDAEDPIKLFDMMGPLYFNMCPIIPKPFSEMLLSASGSKINALMVRSYLQDKHSIPKSDEMTGFQGGISYGKPGIYKNCVRWDLSSLYPSIILTYKVCDLKKDPNQNVLKLVNYFRTKRLEVKRLAAETGDVQYKQLDTTYKGFLNSFFGFYGAPGLNFNSGACANQITGKAREILTKGIKWATSKDFDLQVANKELEDDN